jgi:hypothetical protein
MIQRAYFRHYRMINNLVTAVTFVGSAFLLSYFILGVRP